MNVENRINESWKKKTKSNRNWRQVLLGCKNKQAISTDWVYLIFYFCFFCLHCLIYKQLPLNWIKPIEIFGKTELIIFSSFLFQKIEFA